MTTPFTYIITHIPSNVKYYGVRFAECCHPSDLGTTYFSSSKTVKSLIQEEGISNFAFEVRKLFETKQAAINWESKFLLRVKAAQSPHWFNKNNGGRNFIWPRGKPKSELTKQRMRKPKSTEHRQKLHEHLDKIRTVPEWTDERRENYTKNYSGENHPSFGRKNFARSELNKARKGKTFEELYGDRADELKAKCSVSASQPKKKIECPHCGKIGAVHLMSRYHFDKCKMHVTS